MYNISFDYPTETTDTITFMTSDDLSDIANLSAANKKYLVCNLQWDSTYNNTTTHHNSWYCIIDIDVTNSTIVLDRTITFYSNYIYSSVYGTIFYKYKIAGDTNTTSEGSMTVAVGKNSHAEGSNTRAIGYYSHAEGLHTIASGIYSHVEGYNTTASGTISHAEGISTTSSGGYSHAEGYKTIASATSSHSEGYGTTASGVYSHAEGNGGTAFGRIAHVEGGVGVFTVVLTGEASALTYTVSNDVFLNGRSVDWIINASVSVSSTVVYGSTYSKITEAVIENDKIKSITLDKTLSTSAISSKTYYIYIPNKASGDSSHAEGAATVASGDTSHAEGLSTLASAKYSHAEGYQTVAASESQHVQGRSNIIDSSNTYADIVGNGTSSSRSNAYTLDWSGNAWYAGKVTVGAAPTENMDVATKQYVDNATAGITTNLAGLTDTTITTPADGQVLTYDSTTSKWVNADGGGDAITYTISATNNTITLTGSDSSTSTATFPIYDGTILSTWEGGNF